MPLPAMRSVFIARLTIVFTVANSGVYEVYPTVSYFVLNIYNVDLCDFADMLAATSVLQQQAADIRNQRINWQSYLQ